eukprot:9461715-Lingulodinium_polyedra.AAC.1
MGRFCSPRAARRSSNTGTINAWFHAVANAATNRANEGCDCTGALRVSLDVIPPNNFQSIQTLLCARTMSNHNHSSPSRPNVLATWQCPRATRT